MDSNDYKYFSMLVKELNINRAAQRLFISPQALSKRIMKLEEYYQVKLFERKPSFTLTYAGKRLLEYYEQLSSLETHAKAEMMEIANGRSGELKIGISSSRITQMIPRIFPAYHYKHPNVCIRVLDGHTTSLLQNLVDENVDLTIATSTLNSQDVQCIDLGSEVIKLFISDDLLRETCPEHYSLLIEAEKSSTPVSIEEFRDCPFILSLPGNRMHTTMLRACASRKLNIKEVLSVNNFELRRILKLQHTLHRACPDKAGGSRWGHAQQQAFWGT